MRGGAGAPPSTYEGVPFGSTRPNTVAPTTEPTERERRLAAHTARIEAIRNLPDPGAATRRPRSNVRVVPDDELDTPPPFPADEDRCQHEGVTVDRVAHGYLGDAPRGTRQVLCVDCGSTLAEFPPVIVE